MEIGDFLREIRTCKFCRADQIDWKTPLVYSPISPTVVVVSEMPSIWAWNADIGRVWAESHLLAGGTTGAPHTLCKWLGLDYREAISKLFWIQRANCAVTVGKHFAFQHCSSRFLDRALHLVKPKLILTLGKIAAQYFLRFDRLEDVMGRIRTYEGYDFVALYHPSPAARKWQHRPEQQESIRLAKKRI